MRRTVLLFSVLCLLIRSAFAQAPYNPYAEPVADPRPVLPDGELNWPPFFQSVKMQAKYQGLFAMGACRGTRQDLAESLQANRVDVNHLPTITLSGRTARVEPGMVYIQDVNGQTIAVVTHPANVTKIDVGGTLPADALRPGMVVRLRAKIDSRGRSEEPIKSLEVITGSPDARDVPVKANTKQMIVGEVVQVNHSRFQLKIGVGRLRRVTLELNEHATLDVHASGLAAIHAGDQVTVKGHIYDGVGSLASKTLFASKIEVRPNFASPPVGEGLATTGLPSNSEQLFTP